MNTHQLIPILLISAFVAFWVWSIARSRRWEKYQGEAANRSKAILEAAERDRGRFSEVMALSREQLQVAKELLAEIKALREDLRRSGPPNV
ncbi:MAG: hypothetical protein QOH88_1549 [Verrucomicrobiota bacterium]|jgi:hypothetical protein